MQQALHSVGLLFMGVSLGARPENVNRILAAGGTRLEQRNTCCAANPTNQKYE
jgi:hypothetical protein